MNSIASNSKKSASCGDWIEAYRERLGFFEKLGEQRLLSRTHEKFCVDIMLRYIEQMRLKKDVRIEKETLNAWLGLYRKHLSLTDKKYISLKRRFIYSVFRYFPYAAVVASNAAVIRD